MGFEQSQLENQPEEIIVNPVEKAKNEAAERLKGHSFTTEKGSIYTYGKEGRTSRFKTATNEQHESHDITVFVDFSENDARAFLDAIYSANPDIKRKVYVLEKIPDGSPKIIRRFHDVTDPDRIYLGIIENGKLVLARKATLKPTKGYTVFDTRHFGDGEESKTARHLGHKVTEIK